MVLESANVLLEMISNIKGQLCSLQASQLTLLPKSKMARFGFGHGDITAGEHSEVPKISAKQWLNSKVHWASLPVGVLALEVPQLTLLSLPKKHQKTTAPCHPAVE